MRAIISISYLVCIGLVPTRMARARVIHVRTCWFGAPHDICRLDFNMSVRMFAACQVRVAVIASNRVVSPTSRPAKPDQTQAVTGEGGRSANRPERAAAAA